MKTAPKQRKPTPIEAFLALSDDEKEAEYRSVDRIISRSETKPLTKAEQKLWEKAKRKRGRPRVGEGAARVPISIEKGLLKKVDAFAKSKKMSRSEVLARGAQLVLTARG